MNANAQNFLMGGGVTSAKFQQIGTVVTGTIARDPEVRQQSDFKTKEPKFFKNGDPMMQLVIQLQTAERDPAEPGDDGVRAIYVKGKQFTGVVRDAVKAAGAPGLEVGGTLSIQFVSGGPRFINDPEPEPKVFAAQYVRPVNQAAAGFLNDAGQPAAVAQTAPQPAYSPLNAALANQVNEAPAPQVPNVAPPGVPQVIWDQMDAQQRIKILTALATSTAQ